VQRSGGPGREVAVREEPPPTLRQQIERLEAEFAKAMPAGEAAQFVRDAATCLQTIKHLPESDPLSVMGALMNIAQLGLRPAVLGHAWPLPFWDKNLKWVDEQGRERTGRHRAQMIVGYLGYTHLAYESGRVKVVKANIVREADDFEWDMGSNEPPVHRRPRLGIHRGPVIGYYAVVETVLGGTLVHVMDVPEVIAFRDEFAPRGKYDKELQGCPIVGPWRDAPGKATFDGMAKKTCLRYALKTAPKSAQLARAEQLDGTVRVDATVVREPVAVSSRPAIASPDAVQGEVVDPPSRPEEGPPPVEPDPTTEQGFGEPGFRG
jgi:recombination protein RecT